MKNQVKIAGLCLALSLGLGGPSCNMEEKVSPKIVNTGEIGYNKGTLVSHDFISCSAVVFDYGNFAIMGHSYPSKNTNMCSLVHDRSISCNNHPKATTLLNIIPRMKENSLRMGLDPSRAKVYINAGDISSLEVLTNELAKESIPLKSGEVRWANPSRINSKEFLRTLVYTPGKQKIDVYRDGEYSRVKHECPF